MTSCRREGGKKKKKKRKNHTTKNGGQQQYLLIKIGPKNQPSKALQADHVANDLLFVLCKRHMQSGHGKEYMESFGLLSSNPLESL